MFAGLGSPTHLLLILVVILLLFGAKRLPEMGKSLGQGIKEFKEGINSKEEPAEDEDPKAIEEERARAKPAPGDKPQEEAATTKGSQSPERR